MYVCMLFIGICSTTWLSGKWIEGGKKRVRSGRKVDMVGFFGANKMIGLKCDESLHRQKLLPVYNVTPTLPIRRLQPWFYETWRCAARYSNSDFFVEYRSESAKGRQTYLTLPYIIKLRRRKVELKSLLSFQ